MRRRGSIQVKRASLILAPDHAPAIQPDLERRPPDLVNVWIIASAACALLGWVLSAVGQLNASGCLAGIVVAGVAVVGWGRWSRQSTKTFATLSPGAMWHRMRLQRFRPGLLLLYLVFLVV